MPADYLDIPRLEAFVAIAERGSFTRGAHALNLTQPTITHRISMLERQLGASLFERYGRGRGVVLTDAGRTLLPAARRTLAASREAAETIAALRYGGGGTLAIATAPTIGTYVLPGLLQRFALQEPGVDVAIRTGRSDEVTQMVASDAVQIGFERELAHPEIETTRLYEDGIELMAGPRHPFARRRSASARELAREAVIFYDIGSSYHAMSQAVFRQSTVSPRHAIDVDSLEMAKHLVMRGLGLAFLPRVAVERELAAGELSTVEIDGARPIRRPIAVIHRKGRVLADAARKFLTIVAEVYGVRVEWDRDAALQDAAGEDAAAG